MQFHRGRNY